MKSLINKIKQTLEMIKFSHSVFALPWALAALFFAAKGLPNIKILCLVILAMVFARNTAMSFNRVVDAKIDAENPRTAIRHIPQGLLSSKFVALFSMINACLFVGITYFINQLTFILSPVALFIICFYSLTKRWTSFTQVFLGLSLGIVPMAAWIAYTGALHWFPGLLGLSVLFWVAGFDIIYATQDFEFDKKKGLKSIVVALGIKRALLLSRFFHFLTVTFLIIAGLIYQLHVIYFLTVVLIACFLIYEQSLVKPNNLSKVNAAFFSLNGLVGLLFFLGSLIEVYYYR